MSVRKRVALSGIMVGSTTEESDKVNALITPEDETAKYGGCRI